MLAAEIGEASTAIDQMGVVDSIEGSAPDLEIRLIIADRPPEVADEAERLRPSATRHSKGVIMTLDSLQQQWALRSANAPLHAEMTFVGDALVLGVGAVLVKAAPLRGNGTPDVTSSDDDRLVALLSAAHRRPLPLHALAHIRRAVAKRSEGETVLALIHLALSGVAKLERPAEDARRLFVADELMKTGIAPRAVIDMFRQFTGTLEALDRRYDPNQPRVPAGNGRASGQWTSGDGTTTPTNSSATSPNLGGDRKKEPERRIQIAENSPDWAIASSDRADSASTASSATAVNFAPKSSLPSGNSPLGANISCDDLWDSDKQICLSVLIYEDKHYHGLCMKGALQRYDDCTAGRPLSPLLPY